MGVALGIDRLFAGHPISELFFVMICCPLLMNAGQLVVQDLVLRARTVAGQYQKVDVPERENLSMGLTTQHVDHGGQ